jgi:alpha-L-fucosidase
MKKFARNLVAFTAALFLCAAGAAADDERDKRIQWWKEARFGMFIHWGVYAVPAGEWKGRPIAGIGEWIMNRAKIPVAEYELLTKQFNPVKFNADAWVKVAKDAGMRYIVITSKHHDGFAMYRSAVSRFNIYDATPFKRDPLKELADACARQGLKLGFYYSQTQDWHEPDGNGNTWDWPDEDKKDFAKYYEAKCKPQVREIMTGYGPLVLIWFDTPRNLSREMSQELTDLVHKLQPNCLVSGRVGNGVGDYDSAGDNQISVGKVQREWETPVTLNDTWGFKKDDHNWKTPEVLIRQLILTVSRNGNYLLNVGPTAEGIIPQPSIDRLAEVGKWMRVNSESIYGAGASPFHYRQSWGEITSKPGKLYLQVFQWPEGELVLQGLRNKVTKVTLLAGARDLKFTQARDRTADLDAVRIQVPPTAPDSRVSVIALDINGKPDVDTSLLQQPDGRVTLGSYLADIQKSGSSPLRIDGRGVTERWLAAGGEMLSWEFKAAKPGNYTVELVTSDVKGGGRWDGGHTVKVEIGRQVLSGTVKNDGGEMDPSNPYWPYVVSKFGQVTLDKPGMYSVTLQPERIEAGQKQGFTLVAVRLTPISR